MATSTVMRSRGMPPAMQALDQRPQEQVVGDRPRDVADEDAGALACRAPASSYGGRADRPRQRIAHRGPRIGQLGHRPLADHRRARVPRQPDVHLRLAVENADRRYVHAFVHRCLAFRDQRAPRISLPRLARALGGSRSAHCPARASAGGRIRPMDRHRIHRPFPDARRKRARSSARASRRCRSPASACCSSSRTARGRCRCRSSSGSSGKCSGGKVAALDFLVALGTHRPMDDAELSRLVGVPVVDGRAGESRIFNHEWADPATFATIGEISARRDREALRRPAREAGHRGAQPAHLRLRPDHHLRAGLSARGRRLLGRQQVFLPRHRRRGRHQLHALARRAHHQLRDHRQRLHAGARGHRPRRVDGDGAHRRASRWS